MGTPILRYFGRYFVLDALTKGGMAEVFRAVRAGKTAGNQILVIKQVGQKHAEDESFARMFEDEISTLMRMNHPNIVQLYDCGMQDGKPFIAMEYVFGPSVRELVAAMRHKELPQAIPLAAYIAEQVAGGLHYAHTFSDRLTGKSLPIIHRDITPRNIVVSYEGHVKIIDFGVAKTDDNTEHTRKGIIKGNLAYLSPEQVRARKPDARSDIFALGLVLWELLTGKRFFQTENVAEYEILKQIDGCDRLYRPPSASTPEVPPALDRIVERALQKDRDRRYQTAEELQTDLRRFLRSLPGDLTASGIKAIMESAFRVEREVEQTHIRSLNEDAERALRGLLPLSMLSSRPPITPSAASPVTAGATSRASFSGTATRSPETPSAGRVSPALLRAPKEPSAFSRSVRDTVQSKQFQTKAVVVAVITAVATAVLWGGRPPERDLAALAVSRQAAIAAAPVEVWKGPRGERLSIVALPDRTRQVLIRFENTGGPWDGKVILHEKKVWGYHIDYVTQVNGTDWISLADRSATWGKNGVEANPAGAKPFKILFDEKLSEQTPSEPILSAYGAP